MRDFVYCGYTYQVAYDDLPMDDGPNGRTCQLRKWMERQGYHAFVTPYEKKTRLGKSLRKMILVTPWDRQCPTHAFVVTRGAAYSSLPTETAYRAQRQTLSAQAAPVTIRR
jgi:hypothetical protein